MWLLVRAVTYATLFVGTLLVFLPAQLVSRFGVTTSPAGGMRQAAGGVVTLLGAALALSCVLTFVVVGRGTPAPFDPPRQLVDRGPYRVVRNPMYVGAVLALAGAALYYRSLPLLIYAGFFSLAGHLFVIRYEEPTLRRAFGREYEDYCERVGRWWPKRKSPEEAA